jgi:hypothetical protein
LSTGLHAGHKIQINTGLSGKLKDWLDLLLLDAVDIKQSPRADAGRGCTSTRR